MAQDTNRQHRRETPTAVPRMSTGSPRMLGGRSQCASTAVAAGLLAAVVALAGAAAPRPAGAQHGGGRDGINQQMREDLVRHLGVFTDDPGDATVYEGVTFFNDLPRFAHVVSAGDWADSGGPAARSRASPGRFAGDVVRTALMKYRSLYWQQRKDAKTGREMWVSRAGEMRRGLQKALADFKARHEGPFDAARFAAFLRAKREHAPTCAYLDALSELLHTVEAVGLGPAERELNRQILLRPIKPRGIPVLEFWEVLNKGWPKVIPLPSTRGARRKPPARDRADWPTVKLLPKYPHKPAPRGTDVSIKTDGPRYRVSGVTLSYGRQHPEHPAIDPLTDLGIELSRAADGYVAPREGLPSVKICLKDVPRLPGRTFYASAVKRMTEVFVDYFRGQGIAGVFAGPHREDISSRSGKDLRPEGRDSLRIVLWTTTVGEVRTIASSTKIPILERVNHRRHLGILENCPVWQGDLLRMDRVLAYAVRLSKRPGQHVDVAVSAGLKPGEAALHFLVAGDDFKMPEGK